MNGAQIKEARLVASCTQQEAARKLGVTQAYLSMVERGNRPVSTELTSRAVELFEVPAIALPFKECDSGSRDDSFFACDEEACGQDAAAIQSRWLTFVSSTASESAIEAHAVPAAEINCSCP